MTVVAYLRVSTDEQAESGLGLEAQLAACRAWCERHGGELSSVHRDEGISGATAPTARPGLTDALAALSDGGVLLVAKRDRLARDAFYSVILERTVGTIGARIVSAAGEGTDDDSPTSVLMRRILDAFAEYERLLIGARTKAALRAKGVRGERMGRPPLGQRVQDGPDGPQWVADADEVAVCRVVAAHRSTMSLRAVASRLTTDGVPPLRGGSWNHASVDRAARAGGWSA